MFTFSVAHQKAWGLTNVLNAFQFQKQEWVFFNALLTKPIMHYLNPCILFFFPAFCWCIAAARWILKLNTF